MLSNIKNWVSGGQWELRIVGAIASAFLFYVGAYKSMEVATTLLLGVSLAVSYWIGTDPTSDPDSLESWCRNCGSVLLLVFCGLLPALAFGLYVFGQWNYMPSVFEDVVRISLGIVSVISFYELVLTVGSEVDEG